MERARDAEIWVFFLENEGLYGWEGKIEKKEILKWIQIDSFHCIYPWESRNRVDRWIDSRKIV